MGNWKIIGTKKIGNKRVNIIRCEVCGETKLVTDSELKSLKTHKCKATVIEFDMNKKKSKISGRPVNIKDSDFEVCDDCGCINKEDASFDPYEEEESDLYEFENEKEKEVLDRISREINVPSYTTALIKYLDRL